MARKLAIDACIAASIAGVSSELSDSTISQRISRTTLNAEASRSTSVLIVLAQSRAMPVISMLSGASTLRSFDGCL